MAFGQTCLGGDAGGTLVDGEACMFMPNHAAPPEIHEAAIRIARQCRHIIQACLREEEWGDADREFYLIARQELETLDQSRRNRRKA